MYNIQGTISALPSFWEAITTDGQYIVQVGSDGEPNNHWQDMDSSKTKYWGIVCQQGKIGFDLEKHEIRYNQSVIRLVDKIAGDNFAAKQQTMSGSLLFERRVLITGDKASITEAICLGVGEHRIIVCFYPKFSIDIVQNKR